MGLDCEVGEHLTRMKTILAAVVVTLSVIPALGSEVLPFIENDFAKAVARAKTTTDPIFVEAWAPW